MRTGLLQDWYVNRGDLRIQISLLLFRWASTFRIAGAASWVARRVYLVIVEWIFGIELPWSTVVGERVRVFHGTGLVVHAGARLGSDVVLRQGVCIGETHPGSGVPVIEDGVDIGANACVLGPVRVGARAKIGAGAVVLMDVPPGATVAGVPARMMRTNSQ